MEKVVKIIIDDDGYPTDDKHWHYVVNWDATNRSLCKMEAYGFGDSGAVFKEKRMRAGSITCDRCLAIIKEFKRLKL
jgi:hypothetical protein